MSAIQFLARDPACQEELDWMEFRLTYEGPLMGASRTTTRAGHKHEIRKVFHKQLKHLFGFHPAFSNIQPVNAEEIQALADNGAGGTAIQLAQQNNAFLDRMREFERSGYKFFPLATRELSLLCSIHILFLRPDQPGQIIHSGDIDNRLKTLFDALRIPAGHSELGGYDTPQEGEEPFFCLLEDDSLINQISVETDTLLQPIGDDWNKNDARLVLTVRLWPYRMTWGNIGFA